MSRMSPMEVAALLREIALDYRRGSPEDKALTAAADALETNTVVGVDLGVERVQIVQHPEQEILMGMGL